MTYRDRQNRWLRENDIHVDSLIRVTAKASSGQDGWKDSWIRDMDQFIGKSGKISRVRGSNGLILKFKDFDNVSYAFPYFVLKPLEIWETIEDVEKFN